MSQQALQLHSDTMAEWQVLRQQAEVLVKTGFLPQSIKTPEQAMAVALMGRELGIGMMQAFNNINVIAGKPTVSPQLMLALINRKDELEDIVIGDDGHLCHVTMIRKGRSPHTETFSMDDAARMKTTEYVNGDKQTISLAQKYNWRQMPAVMRKWRAVAACARVVFPDVILGMYTPDEMGAEVEPETGEIVESEPAERKIADRDIESDLIITQIEQAAADRIKQAKENLRTVTADTGPDRSVVKNPKHSPEMAARFDAVVKRLTIRGIKGDELLREANCVLHDLGWKQVKTRYELDDKSAEAVCEMFEKWANSLDRSAQESKTS